MPEEFNKILKYSEGQDFTIMSFLIFAGTKKKKTTLWPLFTDGV